MNLPKEFTERMKSILGSEYQAFYASFSDTPQKGVHLNPKRSREDIILQCSELSFSPIPHIPNGYYYHTSPSENGIKLGMHPLYHSGAVYSQDPAAMLPIGGIEISPDWRVLDMCAAPGGKSSQIASCLSDSNGFLLANEINPGRNKVLISNMERMGYGNVVVTKLSPDEIASYYPEYFHMVLVDAPCSGEGMFRKYPESITEWSEENVLLCRDRQKEILSHAVETLLPGGYLIYSTCTYSVEENEEIVQWMMEQFHLEQVTVPEKIIGVTAPSLNAGISSCCRRFYPHISDGEGQFMAYLKKPGAFPDYTLTVPKDNPVSLKKISNRNMSLVREALADHFELSDLNIYEHNGKIIVLPNAHIKLPPHGITLCGVTAGVIEKNRFIPHHHFFHSFGKCCRNRLEPVSGDPRIWEYLAGREILDDHVSKGYGVLCYEGIPIGGFKASSGRLKNHYPKALRNLLQ